MKSLWLKISLAFFVLILALTLVLWFLLASIMQNAYTETTRDHLIENAEMVSQIIIATEAIDDGERLQEWIRNFDGPIEMRFTVIDEDGTVVADSENDPDTMDNHRNRPEFEAVLSAENEYGETIRYSETQDLNMMYIATPVVSDGETVGAIRTSLSLQIIDEAMRKLWLSLALILGIMLLLTTGAGILIARSITKPIDSVMDVTRRLTEKDYSSRVNTRVSGEIGELSSAVNTLAASLQRQMKEIQENEQQLTSIMSNMVSGVMLINQDGRVELVNSAMEKFFSQHSENVVGQTFDKVGEGIGLGELIRQVFEENKKVHDEVHSYYPEERIMDAHLAPYYGQGWQQKGVIIVLHDITDIRRLEKMRSDFVANVSHELKTPVTSVRGFSETLLSGEVKDEETVRQFLTIIHDESQRLDRLIRDLLNLSKIERQEIPLNVEKVNLTELVHETAVTLQGSAEQKQTNLVLPKEDRAVILEADRDRIRQIILNLIANGINYTHEGGTIEVSLRENIYEIRLIVTDDGIGIPEESLGRIFERFYRVDKARSRHSGGTGLGLAIVKHLIESHKGRIEIESAEDEGTTITVILPKTQNQGN
ncbi:two-component system histidine kinase PnpS [Salinicoccus halodurans]|uniref:Sensor protein kinase WalK n=1 Tax=Salinicoccus halodurans TaxID=407035 RepID=A0A0F7HI38_9STAP|nr:ATP-binding protein [Salinicoccus halodurans]AKG73164.1 histidine kinase [Salinicoccus halodurans]SFK84592.1 histidine kinase [Salinicoccus halodurans]